MNYTTFLAGRVKEDEQCSVCGEEKGGFFRETERAQYCADCWIKGKWLLPFPYQCLKLI